MTNLEFLYALASKPENGQNIPLNQFQEEYASAADSFKRVLREIKNDLENNREYQKKIDGYDILPFSEEVKQALKNRLEILDATYRKHQWYENYKLHLVARQRLLVLYGEYVITLPGCPGEIQNLFKPLEFQKMLSLPIERRLVALAMNTQWSME